MTNKFKQILAVFMIFTITGCTTIPTKNCSNCELEGAPRESFVQIRGSVEDHQFVASGIIINHNDNSTVILTAKHVCKEDEKNVTLVALDIDENEYSVDVLATSKNTDLCLLASKGLIARPSVKVSSTRPKIGEKYFNLAAPLGLFAKQMIPIFAGYYDGRVSIAEQEKPIDVYSIPGFGGSSGSAIFNDKWEVVGVVSMGIPAFPNVMLSVDYDSIHNFVSSEQNKKLPMREVLFNKDLIELFN